MTFGGDNGFNALALSADQATLAGAARDPSKTVKLWDFRGGKERALPLGCGIPTSLAFASGRNLLAVGVQKYDKEFYVGLPEGECQLWEVGTDRRMATLKPGNGRAVTAVQFTADGQLLITGTDDGQVQLWDPAGNAVATLGKHRQRVRALAVSPDQRTLVSGSADATIKLWDLAGRSERATLKGHRGEVTGLAFAEAGQTLVSAGRDRAVKLWDVAAGKPKTALLDQTDAAILSLAMSQDGQMLALGCLDRTVKIVDLRSGQLRAVIPGHPREVTAVAFSADGQLLISASGSTDSRAWIGGGGIKVWKAEP
jgi:WD40 repeat protein